MSKCKYCGKEYDGGGLWDDGFCCGRCRANARDRKISGKIPCGCLYIILAAVAFVMIYSYIHPEENTSKTEQVEKVKQKTEKKTSKKSKKATADKQAEAEKDDFYEYVEDAAPEETKTQPVEDSPMKEVPTQESNMSNTEIDKNNAPTEE